MGMAILFPLVREGGDILLRPGEEHPRQREQPVQRHTAGGYQRASGMLVWRGCSKQGCRCSKRRAGRADDAELRRQ